MQVRRWEVQYLPASGGKVRRVRLSRRGLLVIAVAVSLVLAAMLVGTAILPATARAAMTKLSAGPVQRENAGLHRDLVAERERASEVIGQVSQVLQRGRRLAWLLGVVTPVQSFAVDPVPEVSDGVEVVAAWLERHGQRLAALAEVLAQAGERPAPCALATLPTGAPVEPSRAVPVASYGWHVSPFTGREEAHHGITLAAPAGELVRAPGAGKVVYAGRPRERRANDWMRWGVVVVLDHGCDRLTLFGHLGEVSVRAGTTVRRGDRIGVVGTSGWTRVPALYWETRWPWAGKSRPIDPALVGMWLRLEEAERRFADPTAGLPETFAPLDTLRLTH